MKRLLFFILLFFYFEGSLFAQKKSDSLHIEIKYLAKDATSKTEVSCDKFETAFDQSMYKIYNVTDSFLIAKLKDAYEKISYYKEPDDIDVRYKLFIYFDRNHNNPLIVCMDKLNEAMINGQSVRSEKFFNLLKKVITLIPKEFSVN